MNPENLAVTSFSLSYDKNNPGLDSAYFSIDLEHGVIFNADSLRKGTAINKLVPKITFSNTVTEAVIIMSGGSTREGEVDYRENPTDSIDFTGDVKLRVRAARDEIGMTYTIKVNVHKIETDSLFWDEISYASLPSRYQNPKYMKTVETGEQVVSLIEENDGTYSKIVYESLPEMRYKVSSVTFPFKPAIQTLSSSDDSLWMLDDKGNLWRGDDNLANWTKTGEVWSTMIGSYMSSVVGLKQAGDKLVFSQYPHLDLNETVIPEDFPVKGYSNFVTLSNKWTLSPVAFFVGGITKEGYYSDCTWAFDGAEWIKLSSGGVPAVEGASIIPYYHYRRSSSGQSMIEYKVWMLTGGRESNGSFNRKVYISYNNGVNWTVGTTSMQLPEIIPATYYCDNIVINVEKSANLSDGWKTAANKRQKINYWVDGDLISWECPYIYLFGGYYSNGELNTKLWRGVLGRLTFVPVI